jgi:hypothetical protein
MCRHSCLLQAACLFRVLWGIAPPPLFGTQGALPSLLCVFLLLLFIQFFFSFFPVWGSVCPGGYGDLAQGCLWEYHLLLSSPCGLRLPKPSGPWHLAAAREPSWFLHLTWSGDAMHRLGVWRIKVLPLFSGFSVRCISSISPGFYFWKHIFCFLPLAAILES